jgi:hypothetical protein
MPRLDHIAVESPHPDPSAAFYERLRRALDEALIESEERDHEIAVGLFFRGPDGCQLKAITYRGVA